jgi:glucosamine-6-phosphate deaminase
MIIENYKSSYLASLEVAERIASYIRKTQLENKHCVLGLATGSTPISVYQELVRMHKRENLSFENVYTFNLDEYCGLRKSHMESYYYFMFEHLFSYIDIPHKNIHIPDGKLRENDIHNYCLDYESQISELGGIDIQILGIGRNGHLGFNEPNCNEESITRKIELTETTRIDATPSFGNLSCVPKYALTMGMQTILNARTIYFMAFGESKKQIVETAFTKNITEEVPASFLQSHPRCYICLDQYTNITEQ